MNFGKPMALGVMLCTALTSLSACESSHPKQTTTSHAAPRPTPVPSESSSLGCEVAVTLSPTTVKRGGTLHISATKLPCYDRLSKERRAGLHLALLITMPHGQSAPKIVFDSAGKFQHDFKVPKDAELGEQTLAVVAGCEGDHCSGEEMEFTIAR